jgi:transcriptional regulator with XRE-family HTH domain
VTKQSAPDGIDHLTWRAWWTRHPFRKWRNDNGVSLAAAAKELEVSVTMLQLYEHGTHPIPGERVELAASMMEVPADSLARRLNDHDKRDPRRALSKV